MIPNPQPERAERPKAVDALDGALADWLAAFTVPGPLAAEMADACAAGSAWAAAVGATAVRRAGWDDAGSVAWGIAVGALAGALEAARRSLEEGEGPPEGPTAEGPARPLLAGDGLVAAAHEALANLPPPALSAALAALGETFGDGGPWRGLSARAPRPAWPALLECALAPAEAADPEVPRDPAVRSLLDAARAAARG